jgi:hypothetical protein
VLSVEDIGILLAVLMLCLACGLGGFGLGFSLRGSLENRRQARLNAASQGGLREVPIAALFARTKGEPFTTTLRRHERDARRDRV